MSENLQAAEQIASHILGGRATPAVSQAPIIWPRHGAVEMFFEVPFLLGQQALLGQNSIWADRVVSLQPVFFTSLISTIILRWSKRLTGNLKMAIAIALAATFATMLWPYAYIGLEVKQSFFLLLAGYLALNDEKPPMWPRTLAFGVVAGIAASAKSNGFFLLPALLFLVVCFFWRDWNNVQAIGGVLKNEWRKAACLILIISSFYGVGSYTRAIYWNQHGSLLDYVFRNVLIESPLTFLMNLWSQFFSLNKGLVFFAPLAAVGLFTISKTFRVAPQLAVFSLLVLAGSACSLSLLVPWEDEVWGPRYLHTAVAPLILCLACARRVIQLDWKWKSLLAAATSFGLAVSFLGSLFYYGQLHSAARDSETSTLEHFLNDPRFNHPRFNLKLLNCWLFSRDEQWPAPDRWWFDKPPDAPNPVTVNLRDYVQPQPLMLNSSKSRFLAICLKGAFLLGSSLLAFVCFTAWKRKTRYSPGMTG
ncbi:MAG: hypothetical protein JST85_17410 [Acidobacteria bacterium]|nr:hypothetical protein [Acidobacteriota bacterium]